MLINILTDNRDFVVNLYESQAFEDDDRLREAEITVEEPARVSGAFDGWYELAVSIGIIGVPVGIMVNLFSTWIWESFIKSNKSSGTTIRIVLEQEDDSLEIELTGIESLEDVREQIQSLYKRDDEQ